MTKTRRKKADEDRPEAADPNSRAPLRRRSLGEMAADASPAGGICCPRCGCAHSTVAYTWDVAGARRRKRVCRHCGLDFPTIEK